MSERTKKRRLRLGRKTALAIGLFVLIALGWFCFRLHRARTQFKAVSEIKKLGGWIFYDCRYTEDGRLESARPAGPGWLRGWLGTDFFARVNGVKLTETAQLEGLGDFQLVSRPCSGVTDAAMVHLKPLDELEWLALHNAPVTDAGLSDLERFA